MLQVIAQFTATIRELNSSASDQYKAASANVSQGIQAIRDAASLTVHEIERTDSAAQEMQNLSEEMEASVGSSAVTTKGKPGQRGRNVRFVPEL